MSEPSELESLFEEKWDLLFPDIDLDVQVKIVPRRNFRFDYGNLPSKVLIEIQGGIWVKSAHSTGTGLLRDYEKFNLAQTRGFIVFLLSREMITPEWLKTIADAIREREPKTRMRVELPVRFSPKFVKKIIKKG